MNTYHVIGKNWERGMHCIVFRESVEPAFCMTFEADITNVQRKVKDTGLMQKEKDHLPIHQHPFKNK